MAAGVRVVVKFAVSSSLVEIWKVMLRVDLLMLCIFFHNPSCETNKKMENGRKKNEKDENTIN